MRRVTSGISLLDVAVVVGILLVLAAILFPVFAKPKEGSGRDRFGNAKHFGRACLEYAQDNNDFFPTLEPLEAETNMLSEYVGSVDKNWEPVEKRDMSYIPQWEDFRFQYVLVREFERADGTKRMLLGPLSSIEEPDKTVLAWCSTGFRLRPFCASYVGGFDYGSRFSVELAIPPHLPYDQMGILLQNMILVHKKAQKDVPTIEIPFEKDK